MEAIVVIALVWWLVSAMSAAAKKQQKQQQKTAKAFTEAPPVSAPKASRKPVQTAMSMDDGIPTGPERPMVAPRIAPRVKLTQETADMFAGSMNADSHEGEDPCHEAMLTPEIPAVRPQRIALSKEVVPGHEEASRFTPDFGRDSMLQAFVMQEVLTRPCDRRRPVYRRQA